MREPPNYYNNLRMIDSVPLAQLEPIRTDKTTREAIKDWHYWMEGGYEF